MNSLFEHGKRSLSFCRHSLRTVTLAVSHAFYCLKIIGDNFLPPVVFGILTIGDALQLKVTNKDTVDKERYIGAQFQQCNAVADNIVGHLLYSREDILLEIHVAAKFGVGNIKQGDGLSFKDHIPILIEKCSRVAGIDKPFLYKILQGFLQFHLILMMFRQQRLPCQRCTCPDKLGQL